MTRFVRGLYRTPQDSAYLRRMTEAALRTPAPTAFTLLASSYMLGRRDWRPVLSRIDRPVLYVGTPATKPDADEVRARVAGAEIEILERAGHAVFADDPSSFNTALESFMRRIQ